FGHLRENGAQRWHAGAEGSSAQIREGCLSCVRYRVTAKSTRRIAMTTQILVRNINAAIWLGSRKSPALPAGAEPYLSYSGLLAEGSPVPSAPKTTRGAGLGSCR